MSALTTIPIHEIHRRSDARPLNNDALDGIAEGIEAVGLINPVRVRRIGDGYEVIAGTHRFAARDLLGHREIAAIVVDDDDLHAELAMIDESLFRAELSLVDRAKQTARRKTIYKTLHPETKHGGNLEGAGVAKLAAPDTLRFTADTAAKSGKSERAVQRDAERGEKVTDEVLNLIRGTEIDTGVFLDRLKRLPADLRVATAREALARQNRPQASQPIPAAPENAGAYERFVELIDQLEDLPIAAVIADSGRQRAVLGQRASGLADRMSEIMEGLSQ